MATFRHTDNNTAFDFESALRIASPVCRTIRLSRWTQCSWPWGIPGKKIEFEDEAEDDELEGIVFKIDDATHFEVVVLEELRSVNT